MAGETDNDTYFGGRGEDLLSEFLGVVDASDDELNGGPNRDTIDGFEGDDILRGQEGNEHAPGDPQWSYMLGGPGDDELYGGPGDDAMEGDQGTDEHFGGKNNDYIDASAKQTPDPDAPDLVDCGSSFDTAVVLPNDIVLTNCERVIEE